MMKISVFSKDTSYTENVMNFWLSLPQILSASLGRQYVLWGAYELADRVINRSVFDIKYIVDINTSLHGKGAYRGLDVRAPNLLKSFSSTERPYVIITSTAYIEISSKLLEWGYLPGTDFSVTPDLLNQRSLQDIFNLSGEILFSSSDYSDDELVRNSTVGGGLYSLDLRSGNYRKLYSGVTRGFVKTSEGNIILADASKGIVFLDSQFNQYDIITLPKQAYPHGLALSEDERRIHIVLTRFDAVYTYEIGSNNLLDTYPISSKATNDSQFYYHHINDICSFGESLFVSMFSVSGCNNLGWYDGGIVEYDIKSAKILNVLANDLWMPHSVQVSPLSKDLIILDSMRGRLLLNSKRTQTQFNGFVRGLDYSSPFYYVGQSTHRYFDRISGISSNVSVDCGIFVHHEETCATRFFSTPTLRDINTLRYSINQSFNPACS